MRASKTAEFMALFRALESLHGARLFDDPVAHAFLGPALRPVEFLARVPLGHRLVTTIIDARWPGPRGAAIARTRYIDDAVVEGLDAGFSQVCILGAGYDGRAYRLEGASRARFFEVDHPGTQRQKREKVAQAIGRIPDHVTFVPIDFEREELDACLTRGGFSRSVRSLFVWEGVTNYLTAAAVDQTFRALARLGLPACRVVFTYMHRGVIDGSVTFPEAARWSGAVKNVGEPFRFGFVPEELPRYLPERGFRLVSDVTTAEAGRRYFEPLGRRERGSELYHVAVAEAGAG